MSDFKLFQDTFLKYQKLFGLTGYKVYFKYELMEDSFANITVSQLDRVATVRLNSKLPAKDKPHRDAKQNAKHEAIHLMLQKLGYLARCRYLNEEDIYEATEELVFKLEGLIP